MKILYVLGFLPPYVTREIEAMARIGHTITVLLPRRKSSSETADFWNRISQDPRGSTVTVHRTLESGYLTCSGASLLKRSLKSAKFFRTMKRSLEESEYRYFMVASDAAANLLEQEVPDVIHSHFAHDYASTARIMSSILGVPYTVTTHATDIFVPRSIKRLTRVLKDASMVFTISEYNITHLINYKVPREKIVVTRLGLNLSELPARKPVSGKLAPHAVCTASGLVCKKGVPVLMDAVSILERRHIHCRITVIGSDPEQTKLGEFRQKAKNQKLPMEFVGVLQSGETLKTVASASFFVLPCIEAANKDKDGIPVALMEAMGMGVPCVSTALSGIPELIENGVSGLLVKPGSSEELAGAMEMLIKNRDTADRLGKAGQKKMLIAHSPVKLAEILTEELKKVVDQ